MLTHLNPAPVAPRRTVVLGANGFIARELAAALKAARSAVRAIASSEIDLREAAAAEALASALQPDDAVVMTAALTPDKGKDNATLMQNLRMAESVCSALAKRPVAQLVYLSSDAVYDWRRPLINEATAPSPTDLYSTMHLARERMLAAASGAAGVPLCILRPSAVYGPGDTHNGYGPNRFARSAVASGKIALFGGGEETRDHVAVRDVVNVLSLALAHRSSGTLNVVSGRSISFHELAVLVAGLAGSTVVEPTSRNGPITHRAFDPAALHRSFPQHRVTVLEDGVRELVNSIREKGNGKRETGAVR